MTCIEWSYALGTSINIGGNTNKTSPSKEGGKYLISNTFTLPKLIVVRSDLLLSFVNLNALTILKPTEDKE